MARENTHQVGFEESALVLMSALESAQRLGDRFHLQGFLHQRLCRRHEGTIASLSSSWSLGFLLLSPFPFCFLCFFRCLGHYGRCTA